ncbi:MAG: hypothetical protein ACM3SV_08360 [Betaproteobacteria bacterium]
MAASVQKLREFLGFSRTGDNHAEPKHLHDMLEKLGKQDPLQAIQLLLTQYLPAATAQRNLHMRFKLLESARAEAERRLPHLERMVGEAVLPLPTDAGAAALVADNFLKNMAYAYAGIVSGISAQSQDNLLSHLMQQAGKRVMLVLLRRQLLAYRAYATPSASSWQYMHDLHRAARNRGLAVGGGDHSIERVYLCALLLAYADPYGSPRNELDAIRKTVEALVPLAGIAEATPFSRDHESLAARFLVITSEGHPGRPLARTPEDVPTSGNFIIECRAIVSAIDRKLAAAENGANDVEINASPKLLMNLRTAFGGQVSRRFSRVRFKPKTDLVAGFDNVVKFIASGALSRRHHDQELLSPAERPPYSEWALINESPDGFGIRYLKGEKWNIQAGDLVVLRTREDSRIHACLVRRIANLDHKKLELGLQELSPGADIIKLASGEPALLMPRLPAFGGNAGLIVRPGSVGENTEIGVDRGNGITRWRPSGQAESNGQIEFHVLEPVE